ncbi:LAMI_0G04500g1_1 [Lachancea mirantina]|uniref:glutaminase n=1 Tax=Lachancea mirantina TaxID=1230905 RepID=A0A1G4K8H9_9SACH|nr:LAMI_0G04500g1_1 [Lachancea mirantina]
MKIVGVLALQGAFIEHVQYVQQCIEKSGYALEVKTVRTPSELSSCDALIIPGGESTAISQIAERNELLGPLQKFVQQPEKAVWGTCAGLIFLASELTNEANLVRNLGCLKVAVKRNAFGRQSHSFVADLDFSSFLPGGEAFPTVFIRAPVVEKILGDDVQVLHSIQSPSGGDLVVAVRQGNVLGTSFHPELADDIRFHDWFLKEFVI